MRLCFIVSTPLVISLVGCVPRIEVAAPEKPITIDMNVNIQHTITIKADSPTEQLINQRQQQAPTQRLPLSQSKD